MRPIGTRRRIVLAPPAAPGVRVPGPAVTRASSDPAGRLALLGDVHGNASALAAVLADVRRRGIAYGVITGDIAMRGTDPAAAVRAVRELGWPCVIGNTDIRVGAGRPRPSGHPASDRVGSRSWTIRRLSDDDRLWLAALPRQLTVAVGAVRVLVTHGSPGDLPVVVDESTPARELRRLARALDVHVVVIGHTHRPMVRTAGGTVFVNPGSVGEGVDDDHRPAWAWLETAGAEVHVHLERVDVPLAPPRSA